ncbi:hypothetical protein P879_06960 [Paragonimus westermani]|uniref:C2H2-type domain-containing protein n=1 Tax=Paragonimus westermani TaxID=34504 RepID=A0A8T0D6E9_9TREM|nr:hypothetical protein P879_06960 [Paragonimus westermani]
MAGIHYPENRDHTFSGWTVNPIPNWSYPMLPTQITSVYSELNNPHLTDRSTYDVSITPYGEVFMCKLCGVTCTGRISYEQHVRGSQHKRITQSKVQTTCHVCNCTFTSSGQLNDHLKGSRHRKKANASSPSVSFPVDSSKVATENDAFKCIPCNLDCSSHSQLTQHLAGKKHAKSLKVHRLKWASSSERSSLLNCSSEGAPSLFDGSQVGNNSQSPSETPTSTESVQVFTTTVDPLTHLMDLETALIGLQLSTFPPLESCYATSGPLSRYPCQQSTQTQRASFCRHVDCVVLRALKSYEFTLQRAGNPMEKPTGV